MKLTTILLADESGEVREAIRDLLVDLGYEVSTASGSAEAIRLFEADGPFDVLVADSAMPGVDGVDLARELVSRHGDLGIVLMTSGVALPAGHGRLEPSRFRTLKKPFSAAGLQASVEESLTVTGSALRWPDPAPARSGANARTGPAASRWFGQGLLAAAALLLVAGGLVYSRQLVAPPLPEATEGGITRGAAPRLMEPVGELARSPGDLAWEDFAGASSYRVRILGVDGAVLWAGTAYAGRIAFPQDITGGFHAGVMYSWQVDALDSGGDVVARSPTARFRVTTAEPTAPR